MPARTLKCLHPTKARCRLEALGWSQETRLALERLITQGAGKHLPVVFDLDNTIICGDIGEATFAVLARSGEIAPSHIPQTLSPPIRLPGQGLSTLQTSADVAAYYEAFLAPTAHGAKDPMPLANAYAWAVEIMQGLRPSDVVTATRRAFEWPRPTTPAFIEAGAGKTAYPVPFFYPEMVELIAALMRHEFDVWIVSASNVWSVRWIVLHALNPLLRELDVREGLRSDHVIGISTLLTDRRGCLYKDALLVRDDPAYAALDRKRLGALRLTSRLQFPVPTYSGKVAAILDAFGQNPYLAAGDSPGDHSMLAFSQHRLWIGRLEKPGFQQATAALMRRTGRRGWTVQPVLSKQAPGFLPEIKGVSQRLKQASPDIRKSIRILSAL